VGVGEVWKKVSRGRIFGEIKTFFMGGELVGTFPGNYPPFKKFYIGGWGFVGVEGDSPQIGGGKKGANFLFSKGV